MRGWQAPAYGVRSVRRWVATVVVLVVAAGTGGLMVAVTAANPVVEGATAEAVAPHGPALRALPGAAPVTDSGVPLPAVPRGEPIRVVIPAIDVDAALVRLGLRPDRSMETPAFGLAGWYDKGPRPGHPGPAVLAAHVDSRAGPDVFFRLRDLVANDRVHVQYDSGDRVTFVVTRSERTAKDALPVSSIWPLTNDRLLALITCGGTFDRNARSYQDNVIVYAVPLDL